MPDPYSGAVVAERRDPYPPSWVDRLIDRIDSLPVAAWILYLAVFIIVTVVANVFFWFEGLASVGQFDPYANSAGAYLLIGYGAIHYLDRATTRAWATFRPALTLDDEAADRVAYELTTMPARPTLGATILGLLIGVVYLASQYGKPLDLEGEPVTFIFGSVVSLVGYAGTTTFIYHSLRQLRLISRMSRHLASVDLLHLERLHAFARVTAMTGIVLLAIGYLAVPTNPYASSNPAVIAFFIATIGLAIASFVVPLYGIHDAIVAEKWRRLEAVNRLLDLALADLHRRAEERDLSEADAVNKHISSLLAEREVLARTPTWPWGTETLRGFVTALVLPVLVWLVLRLLGQAMV